MHFPKNNLSKGLNESKEKIDSLNFNKTHHFSPNISKKTVGINLNNFLSSKPNMLKDDNEMQNNESLKNIKVNASYNSNHLSGSVVSSNFQKYTKSNVTNIKSSVINNSNYSVVNTTNTNNVNISNTNNNMNSTSNSNSNYSAFPNKNIKLESIKNINNVIKKLKGTNVNSNPIHIQQGTIKGKIDVNKQLIALKNKTQIIPAINSNQNSNLQSNSNISSEFQNVIHMSSNSMNNMSNINNVNTNGLKSDKINLRNSNNLYGSQIENMSLFQQGIPNNSSLIENNEVSNNRNHSYNLYSNNSEKKSTSLFRPENIDKNSEETDLNIAKSCKKVSLQDTKDNSSNSSTIKFKHSNNTSISMGGLGNNSNIENPEDLHFFYVKMFQQNKELAFKFEKD